MDIVKKNIEYLESTEVIDKIGNLSSTWVFLFNGLLDTEIPVSSGKFSELVWKEFTTNVKGNFTIESEHNMVTDFYGWKCKYVRKPWISNC